MRERSPGLRSHLRSHSLSPGHPVAQLKGLYASVSGERIARNQLPLALPDRHTSSERRRETTPDRENAAQLSPTALSRQSVLTRHQDIRKAASNALTCGRAQLGSNQ
jgi:hypothetical protein